MRVARRRSKIDPAHHRLSISAQCRLLCISRSAYYYAPVPETDETLALMEVIDATFLDCPWYGSRQMARHLKRIGHDVGRRRARRLMARMGLMPIYQRPRTSDPHPQHRVYPYLLRKLKITRPAQVWCADVMYIPMRRGFLHLVAVMDWATRKVPAWRLSDTMDAGFCVAALEEALARFGKPEISTPIRAANLPALPSSASCATPRCGSAWMDAGGGWTMSSLSGCGGLSSIKASTCTPSKPDRSFALALPNGSPITIACDRTRVWLGKPRQRPMDGSRNQMMGGMPHHLMTRMAA
jgi:putative transposase